MERTSAAEEAILLASEPGDVRAYLQKRAETSAFWDPISAETEAELLSRNDRLIDLSLAEYCRHHETALALFERDPEDWPIRALVLSNEVLARSGSLLVGFPESLFGSEDALLDFLRKISPDERSILFSNPTLDNKFLEAFLSLERPWEVMHPEQRLWALHNLAANPKLRRERSMQDHDDGWGWYMDGRPFEAAWLLIEKLEPTKENADHLSALLRDLPADSYNTGGIHEALGKWQASASDLESEAEANEKCQLSDFQKVRQAGARLLASRHDAEPDLFFDSEDIALRCGSYEAARSLNEKSMKVAIERDGDLARLHFVRNERMWCNEKSRRLILDLVLRDAESEEPRWEFSRKERQYREVHPAWFDDEEYVEPDDRSLSESSISDVVNAISSDPALRNLHDRVASIEKSVQYLLWMVAITLGLLVALTWD